MIERFIAMKVKCDRCGEYHRLSYMAEAWSANDKDALESARDDGWTAIGLEHYCPQCSDEMEVDKDV